MHLVVINGSPRTEKKSNTAKIITSFLRGFKTEGNTSEVWHLSDREQWASAMTAYHNNEYILIAFPLYVENLPGILMEFIEKLNFDNDIMKEHKKKIAFLVQGGFAEASQLRCCEAYLEKLPEYLSSGFRVFFALILKHVQRMMFRKIAKEKGCTEPLDKKVYTCS